MGADYVFAVKKNQEKLYEDIGEMIDFKSTDLCEIKNAPLEKVVKTEKGHGRIETRRSLVTHEVEWLNERCKFKGIQAIGAILTASETRYYISSGLYLQKNYLKSRDKSVRLKVCIGSLTLFLAKMQQPYTKRILKKP